MLISALVLAILYFALMELMMIDASRALAEARRFRSRIVAANLAENGAELAAVQIITRTHAKAVRVDDWGNMSGLMNRVGDSFTIKGDGEVVGTDPQLATVSVQGRIDPDGSLHIDYTMHGQ